MAAINFLDIFSESHTDSLVDPKLRVDSELLPSTEWTAVPPKKDVIKRWQIYSSITFTQMKSFADENSAVKNEPLVQAVRTGDYIVLSHLWDKGTWSDDNNVDGGTITTGNCSPPSEKENPPGDSPASSSRNNSVSNPILLSNWKMAKSKVQGLYLEDRFLLSISREIQEFVKPENIQFLIDYLRKYCTISSVKDIIRSFDRREVKWRTRLLFAPESKAESSLIRPLGPCSAWRSRSVPYPIEHHDLEAPENNPLSTLTTTHPTLSDPIFPAMEVIQYLNLSSYNRQLLSIILECSVNPNLGDLEMIWNSLASHLSHYTTQPRAMQLLTHQRNLSARDPKILLQLLKRFSSNAECSSENFKQEAKLIQEGTKVLKQVTSFLSRDDNALITVYGDLHGLHQWPQLFTKRRHFYRAAENEPYIKVLQTQRFDGEEDEDEVGEYDDLRRRSRFGGGDLLEPRYLFDEYLEFEPVSFGIEDGLPKGCYEEWGSLQFPFSRARIGKLLDRDYVWAVTQTMVSFENLALWAVHTMRYYKVYPGFWGRIILSFKKSSIK